MSIAHASSAPAEAKDTHARAGFWTLTLGSVGVVYGDIGTSPLYALKESLTAAAAGGALTREMVLGVMSLMLWALIIVVTLKYVLLILRADNNGEGGTLTLMALLQRVMGHNVLAVTLLGMAGAALFYGDAIITPAISVLSAVEGLKLATPAFEPYVIPLSLAILVGLFSRAEPRHGRGRGLVRPDHRRLVRRHGGRRARSTSRTIRASSPRSARPTASASSSTTAMAGCSRSAPCSWPSPAPRRSTPTWAISGGSRSRPPGSASCCRRSPSTISARARCC